MDRRRFLRTGAGAAAGLVLASCNPFEGGEARAGDPSKPSPRVTLRLPGGNQGLPSPFSYSPATFLLVLNIYDTLLWTDPEGKLIGWLAKNHSVSDDGLLHTVDLKDGVLWQDGRPFTAEDVVFSFEYFETHRAKLPPFVLIRPEGVQEVKVAAPGRVEFRLDKPRITFARHVLGQFPIFPKHVWSKVADPVAAQDQKLLVGTGPYRLAESRQGQGAYLLQAFDRFHLGRPFVKRLEFHAVGDPATAVVAGEVDAATIGGSMGQATIDRFRRDPSLGVLSGPFDGGAFLYFDPRKGDPVSHLAFRRACALAIDRTDLVRRATGGNGAPGNPGFLPPDHPFRTRVQQYRHNPAAAGRLLDEAGYPMGPEGVRLGRDGKALRLKTMVIPALEAAFEVVQSDLKAVGIDIFPDPVDPIEVFAGRKLDYQLAIRPLFNLSADPDFMRTVFSSRAEQRFFAPEGYVNPELDDLGEQQLVTTDPAKRRSIIDRMQQIVAEDLPFLPLYYDRSVFLYRKAVFDQWSYTHSGGGPMNKQILVTGLKRGTEIRPIKNA